MEYHGMNHNLTEILFSGKRTTFIQGEHSRGVANAWDHLSSLHKHSHPPPKQCKHIEAAA